LPISTIPIHINDTNSQSCLPYSSLAFHLDDKPGCRDEHDYPPLPRQTTLGARFPIPVNQASQQANKFPGKAPTPHHARFGRSGVGRQTPCEPRDRRAGRIWRMRLRRRRRRVQTDRPAVRLRDPPCRLAADGRAVRAGVRALAAPSLEVSRSLDDLQEQPMGGTRSLWLTNRCAGPVSLPRPHRFFSATGPASAARDGPAHHQLVSAWLLFVLEAVLPGERRGSLPRRHSQRPPFRRAGALLGKRPTSPSTVLKTRRTRSPQSSSAVELQ